MHTGLSGGDGVRGSTLARGGARCVGQFSWSMERANRRAGAMQHERSRHAGLSYWPHRWLADKSGADVMHCGTNATKPDLSFPIQNVHD